jgi:ABC-type uncharacterized transport system permease subunit
MTTLQTILGRNYRWLYITKFALKAETGSLISFLLKYLSSIITIVSSTYIWNLVSQSQADLTIFAYILQGKIYYELTSNNYFFRLGNLIHSGKINKILYPVNFSLYQYFEMIGTRITKNLFSIIGTFIGVGICYFTFAGFPLNFENYFYLIPLIPITFTICHFLGVILGTFSFWFTSYQDQDGFHSSIGAMYMILSGSLIPIFKFPNDTFRLFLELLPTSFMLHHPAQIITGQYALSKIVLTYLGGLAWCFILWIISRIAFKVGLRKNEAVGL